MTTTHRRIRLALAGGLALSTLVAAWPARATVSPAAPPVTAAARHALGALLARALPTLTPCDIAAMQASIDARQLMRSDASYLAPLRIFRDGTATVRACLHAQRQLATLPLPATLRPYRIVQTLMTGYVQYAADSRALGAEVVAVERALVQGHDTMTALRVLKRDAQRWSVDRGTLQSVLQRMRRAWGLT